MLGDSSVIFREGKWWLYFKSRRDTETNKDTRIGVAVADVLKKAATTVKQDDRAKLYQQAEKLIYDKTIRIFMGNNQPPLAFLANVDGYVVNPTGSEYFNTVVVK